MRTAQFVLALAGGCSAFVRTALQDERSVRYNGKVSPAVCTRCVLASPRRRNFLSSPSMATLKAPIIAKRSWQTILSGAVCFRVITQLTATTPPPLFALHVYCMAPMLPLGAATVSTIRARLRPPRSKPRSAAERKKRMEWFVIRHFLTSATALYAAGVGIAAIWRNKMLNHAAHLSTAHGRLGAIAFVLWLSAYAVAQPHVWRDQWRARRFSLFTNKRWLWSSTLHQRLGTVAFAVVRATSLCSNAPLCCHGLAALQSHASCMLAAPQSLLAYASGMLGWRSMDATTARLCSVAVGAVGATMLGKRGAIEVARTATAGFQLVANQLGGRSGKRNPPP